MRCLSNIFLHSMSFRDVKLAPRKMDHIDSKGSLPIGLFWLKLIQQGDRTAKRAQPKYYNNN